jgi:hypothetical protein
MIKLQLINAKDIYRYVLVNADIIYDTPIVKSLFRIKYVFVTNLMVGKKNIIFWRFSFKFCCISCIKGKLLWSHSFGRALIAGIIREWIMPFISSHWRVLKNGVDIYKIIMTSCQTFYCTNEKGKCEKNL